MSTVAETAVAPATQTQAVDKPVMQQRALPQYETVSIEDEGAASRADLDFFKGEKNTTHRLGILGFNQIMAARTHFNEVMQSSVLCRSEFVRQETAGAEGKKIYSDVMVKRAGCCEILGESNKRFAVPVIVYGTKPDGTPVKPFTYSLKIWRFGVTQFQNLQGIHSEFKPSGGLGTHDIKFACTDAQYQKGNVSAAADCVFAQPQFQEKYGAEVANWLLVVKDELKRAIGRDMSDAEIKKKLGEAPASAAQVPEQQPVSTLADLLS